MLNPQCLLCLVSSPFNIKDQHKNGLVCKSHQMLTISTEDLLATEKRAQWCGIVSFSYDNSIPLKSKLVSLQDRLHPENTMQRLEWILHVAPYIGIQLTRMTRIARIVAAFLFSHTSEKWKQNYNFWLKVAGAFWIPLRRLIAIRKVSRNMFLLVGASNHEKRWQLACHCWCY